MASQSPLNSSLAQELECPVCFEEFDCPKCLPSCAHNVCRRCLQNIASTRKRFECPICRGRIILPRGGVDALPTNTLLVRLVDRGRKPTPKAEESPDLTRQKVQKLGDVATNYILHAHTKGEEIRKTIKDESDAFIAAIRKREEKLNSEVDDLVQVYENLVSFRMHQVERNTTNKETGKVVCENSNADESLEEHEVDLLLQKIQDIELNDNDDSLAKAGGIPKFCLQFELDVSAAAKFVKTFGTLKAASDVDGKKLLPSDSSATTTDDVRADLQVVKHITATDLGDTALTPYAVTASGDRIAILDDDLNRIHVLTDKGNHINSFTIKYGDLYDLAFVGKEFVYVVNRSHKTVIRYFCNGRYCPPDIRSPPAMRYDASASFTSISVMTRGKDVMFLVSVDALSNSCVLVGDAQGIWLSSFGFGDLQCPRKTLYHRGEYFVCDRDLGCVKVFTSKGVFVREFGEDMDSPRGLAIDEKEGNVLVTDPGSDTIHVYNRKGTHLAVCKTEAPPSSIAMLQNGDVITCFHDEPPCCAQIISYTIKQT